MKKWLPWIVVVVFAGWLVGSLRMPKDKEWAYGAFGRLPLTANGRVQPFDSLARNTLLQLREKQTANLEPWKGWNEHPKIISATEWLLAVIMKPEQADGWPVFRIDHPDLKGLLALRGEPDLANKQDGKHYSWLQIEPKLADLRREALRASKVENSKRTSYDQSLMKLWAAQEVYNRLKFTLGPAGSGRLKEGLKPYLEKIEAGRTALMAQMEKRSFDESALEWLQDQIETPLVVPIQADPHSKNPQWEHVIENIAQSNNSGAPLNFSIAEYDKMTRAYRSGDAAEFNATVAEYQSQLAEKQFTPALKKSRAEQFFNFVEPFYKAMILDLCAFLFVLGYWFRPGGSDYLRRTAVALVLLAVVVHTGGLVFRMVLEGRPPVTNLYSSAIFIGWGATILGLILERFWRNSIGVAVSAIIGFLTLIIAHHLSLSGDTMEMMRAVLDTNFWLATHVVVVTLGYASTFVAGFLAILYIILGVFTPRLSQPMTEGVATATAIAAGAAGGLTSAGRAARTANQTIVGMELAGKMLTRMIYGIICFAALFSFVGTVLGGIWADQSWGRFWGWDVKENGALIIVLWNALILHARWGGLVKERGLAVMAIVGNIVTSWSWFGVNMLGIGLHSYGFTDAAFRWLVAFVGSQLILIVLGVLPKHMWQSFRGMENSPSGNAKKELASAAR